MQFATCCFSEYRDWMGGIPVRTANGTPRYRLKFAPHHASLLPTLPATFPAWPLVQEARTGLPWEAFRERYLYRLDGHGVDQVREQAQAIVDHPDYWSRVLGREVTAESPLVLLCYEKLSVPGEFCHRRALAAWLEGNLPEVGGHVPEFGSVPQPETAGEQAEHDTLF